LNGANLICGASRSSTGDPGGKTEKEARRQAQCQEFTAMRSFHWLIDSHRILMSSRNRKEYDRHWEHLAVATLKYGTIRVVKYQRAHAGLRIILIPSGAARHFFPSKQFPDPCLILKIRKAGYTKRQFLGYLEIV